ncbi:MAG: hypothetical protein K2I75_03205 [Clostridiales bacterium]|nr:hypothetical protein [Clostridiales bacterium]
MLKHTKRGIFILLVMLCITFAFAIGCGSIEMPGGIGGGDNPITPKPPGPTGDKPQLSSVVTSSVTFEETARTLIVEWDAVPYATSYTLRITKGTSTSAFMTTVEDPTVDLRQITGFTLPDNGSITIKFTAKANDYIDSDISEITYELEGTLLLSPEITSFDNDVIAWKKVSGASSYTVKVNGVASETQTNSYNVSSLTGNSTIEISAKIGSKTGSVTKVMYDATAKKLSVMPIIDFTLDGDILRWGEVGGAVGYKVVDLDFNSYTVTTPYYIMSTRNVVYGVYPVMDAKSVVASAEVVPVDIKYLDGKGTQAEPYLIKTPFELRTVDYYELKYAEAVDAAPTGTTVPKNYYKIANDLNYSTVSVLESESNTFTLRKPFMGVLNGDGHTLSNISVTHDNGFWALFEFIATGATVNNIKFDGVEIINDMQKEDFPINPATAMVAYRNYGVVTAVTLSNARFTVTGGGAAGLVIHNYGKVIGCTVSGCELKEAPTTLVGSAMYEMGGVVLENCSGGEVSGNVVNGLTITGTANKEGKNNVGSAAGVVSINRTKATVKDNTYNNVTINNNVVKEAGGVVAYCANGGTVTKGSGTLGTLTVNNTPVNSENGVGGKGKLYGKKD